ncbi:uncharacterized protein LOC141912691 [Tubulanus polymorphus]|uniref:uncharacterized protein LOC141912691 n=1 Tax=Tubulanus polymorphus TaxID=672921 RepID=UPI003DA4271A
MDEDDVLCLWSGESSSEYEDFWRAEKLKKNRKNEKNRQSKTTAAAAAADSDESENQGESTSHLNESVTIIKDSESQSIGKRKLSVRKNRNDDESVEENRESEEQTAPPRRQLILHDSLLPLFDTDTDDREGAASDEEEDDSRERASLATFLRTKEKKKRKRKFKKLDKVSRAFSQTNISESTDNRSTDGPQPTTSLDLTDTTSLDLADGSSSRTARRSTPEFPRAKKHHRHHLNGSRHHGQKRARESSEDGASPVAIHDPVPVTVAMHHIRKGRRRPRPRTRTNEDLLDILSNSDNETAAVAAVAAAADSILNTGMHWISPPRLHRSARRSSRTQRSPRPRESLGGSPSFTPETQRTISQFQQIEDDEDMARRLQEEMDHEFAVALNAQGTTAPPSGHTHETHHHHHHHHQPNHPRSHHTSRSRGRYRSTGNTNLWFTEDDNLGIPFDAMAPFVDQFMSLSRLEQQMYSSPTRNRRGSGNRSRGRVNHRTRFLAVEDDSYEHLLALGELLGDAVPRGLETTAINQLPTHRFNSSSARSLECSICMTEFENNDHLRILPCFHDFHTKCIDQWIQTNATCPICRVAIKLE